MNLGKMMEVKEDANKSDNHEAVKFTKNEQTVIKSILDEPNISDLGIAQKMGISQQAVFKIRHKLEESGVIQGYTPIINFQKVGVRDLIVLGIQFFPHVWQEHTEEEITQNILNIPQVISAYRIPGSTLTHLLIMGFMNLEQRDEYLMKLQTKYARDIRIVHLYPFSVERVIKRNSVGLIESVIDKKPLAQNSFFFNERKKK